LLLLEGFGMLVQRGWLLFRLLACGFFFLLLFLRDGCGSLS
jgi:hypothetical protein